MVASLTPVATHALIVDLNNFASFPTLAIGLLCAALRKEGRQVRIICPLSYGVPASFREHQENWKHQLQRRIHLSTSPSFRRFRDLARALRNRWNTKPDKLVLRAFQTALDAKPDIVLLSAYLQHYESVRAMCRLALERNIPVLLGGPMFNVEGTANAWRNLPGLVAIVGAEVDLHIGAIADAIVRGEDLLAFPGVTLPDGRSSGQAAPLKDLDLVPVPDFSDFPWSQYPVRIIPVMTGRGCQWSQCVFCSDVVSASGRHFRSRSVGQVLAELREQSQRYQTNNFLFLDLKLNSNPSMLRELSQRMQDHIPGARWIGTVHVDQRSDNGLSLEDLQAAYRGGMRRMSFGLESGSQRLLDSLKKGSSVEGNSEFIRNAHRVGLSLRCTMFKGFPGETCEDMRLTAAFLQKHAGYLDRVRFNEFSLLENTPIYHSVFAASESGKPMLERLRPDPRNACASYLNRETASRDYRRQKALALNLVHAINRRPMRLEARQFDGLM